VANCQHCGAELPYQSRYCPQCGRLSARDPTAVLDLPTEETGPVPVNYDKAEARYYGVAPATLVLVLAGLALAGAIVLAAIGRWPIGLILLGVSLLLFVAFLETSRRRPRGTVTRSTADAFHGLRARTGAAVASVGTRGRASRQVLALRRELQRIAVRRRQLLLELGDAVYRGDEQAVKTAREQVKELDALAATREEEMRTVVAEAHERIQQRRLEVRPTEMVELPDEPAPDETITPEPARIPEQYPPPDEGTPPQPAIIPEPGPAVIPEPGPSEREEAR
jgi:hypothetical protein